WQEPAALQDVLPARIDRLGEAPKRLLQTAAVIGRETSLRLLEAALERAGGLDRGLADLVRLELLSERGTGRERVFVFKHALIQEAAYTSLPEGSRRALHAVVGRALAGLHAGRAEQVAELLAHHFGQSG